MKRLSMLVSSLMMAGSVSILQAQGPDPMPYPGYERPLPPNASSYRYRGRIRVEKDMNEEGYQLRIYTTGDVDPASVQVSIQGPTILIENDRSFQREERGEEGYYSYSRSSNAFRRRLSIPRNADVENMQRRVEAGVLIITFPYLHEYRY